MLENTNVVTTFYIILAPLNFFLLGLMLIFLCNKVEVMNARLSWVFDWKMRCVLLRKTCLLYGIHILKQLIHFFLFSTFLYFCSHINNNEEVVACLLKTNCSHVGKIFMLSAYMYLQNSLYYVSFTSSGNWQTVMMYTTWSLNKNLIFKSITV